MRNMTYDLNRLRELDLLAFFVIYWRFQAVHAPITIGIGNTTSTMIQCQMLNVPMSQSPRMSLSSGLPVSRSLRTALCA